MIAEKVKQEALMNLEEVIDGLIDMVNQHCSCNGGLDSMALSSNAFAMRTLSQIGVLKIETDVGRRVIGKWKEQDDQPGEEV